MNRPLVTSATQPLQNFRCWLVGSYSTSTASDFIQDQALFDMYTQMHICMYTLMLGEAEGDLRQAGPDDDKLNSGTRP